MAEGQLPGTRVLVGVAGSRSEAKAGVRLDGAQAAMLDGASAGWGLFTREAGGQGAAQPRVAAGGRHWTLELGAKALCVGAKLGLGEALLRD